MTEVAGAVVAVVAAATAATGDAPGGADWLAPPRPEPLDTVLPVSTATTPYLLDHCLAAQRAGWPDEEDRAPVVPPATLLAHMAAAAELAAPGRRPAELADVRFHRWLDAAPPVAVAVHVRPLDADRVHAALADYAECVVTLDGQQASAPSPWPEPRLDRSPLLAAHQLYDQRWMLHGAAFQTITRTLAAGPDGIRAVLRPGNAPGSLLDGAGQVLGQWLIEHHPESWIAFPASIDRVTFHAEPPAVGADVECTMRITEVTDTEAAADLRLTGADGAALVTVTGWCNRRLVGGPRAGMVHRFADLNTLSVHQPRGWHLLVAPWPDLPSRDLHVRTYLSASERAEYRRQRPGARQAWLLRRIVVKDAVRDWLWDHGHGPLFPAEIELLDGPNGECTVRGRHGLQLPVLDVAADADRDIGVALVRAGRVGGRRALMRVVAGSGPPAPGCSDSCPVTGPDGRVHTVSWN